MEEGYMALYVAIVKQVTPEKAFDLLNGKKNSRAKKKNRKWTDTEILMMEIMHSQGMKWADVARNFRIEPELARSLTYARRKSRGELKA